jgi:hypothetical protein
MTELDPLLREAMARVSHPVAPRPSISDIHRRARRHNRRRMTAMAAALACTGAATTALIIRRDAAGTAAGVPGGNSTTTNSAPALNPSTTWYGSPTSIYSSFPIGQSVPEAVEVTAELLGEAVFAADEAAPFSVGQVLTDQQISDLVEYVRSFVDGGWNGGDGQPVLMRASLLWSAIGSYFGLSFDELTAMNPGVNFANPPQRGEVIVVRSSDTAGLPYSPTTSVESIPLAADTSTT